MPTLSPANPFVYAQFRLGGGWKVLATVCGIYTAVVGGLVLVSLTADRSNSVGREWPQALLMLQVLALFIVGLLRVNAAVRHDVSSRMIESHRLMPTPPATAVVGYVLGGSVLGLALAAINFGLGAVCCASAGLDLDRYAVDNAVMVAAAVLVYFVCVHLALAHRFGLFLLLAIAFAAFVAGNEENRLLPGMGLLTGSVTEPLLGWRRRFSAASSDLGVTPFSLLALVPIAAVSFRAATRLYRSSDRPGVTGPLGLALVCVWAAASVFALSHEGVVYPRRFFYGAADLQTQVVATVVTGLLVSVVAIAGAGRAARDRRRPPVWVPILAAVATAAVPFVVRSRRGDGWEGDLFASTRASVAVAGYTLAVCVGFVAGLAALTHSAYRRRAPAWPIGFLWVIVTWVLPLLFEAFRQAAAGRSLPPGAAFDLSPIGALATVWTRTGQPRPLGPVAVQLGVATLVVLVTMRRSRRAVDGVTF